MLVGKQHPMGVPAGYIIFYLQGLPFMFWTTWREVVQDFVQSKMFGTDNLSNER